jgi:gag-polypeptide of LTR copia-type
LNLKQKLHGLVRTSSTTKLTDQKNSFRDTLEDLCAIGKVLDVDDLIIMDLQSLLEEYQNVAGMLEMSMAGMTLEDVMAKVQNVEKRMGLMAGSSSPAAAAPTVVASQASFLGGKSSGGMSNQKCSSKFQKDVNCHYCDKGSRLQTECRKKIADNEEGTGKPTSHSGNGSSGGKGGSKYSSSYASANYTTVDSNKEFEYFAYQATADSPTIRCGPSSM